MKKNLKLFYIPEKNLKGFTTTENDKKRDVTRFPPDNFRNFTQDIFKEEIQEITAGQSKDVDFSNIDGYGKGKQNARDDKNENVEENDPDALDEVQNSVAEQPANP